MQKKSCQSKQSSCMVMYFGSGGVCVRCCLHVRLLLMQPVYLYAPGWKHYRKKLLGPAARGRGSKGGASNPVFNPYTLLFITRMRRTVVKRKVKVLMLYASVSGTAKTFAHQVRLFRDIANMCFPFSNSRRRCSDPTVLKGRQQDIK